MEVLRTDLTRWTVGPYHALLPGPLRLHLDLDGEVVVQAEVEAGYLHKGFEKTLEMQSWRALPAYADHLDPEAAVFGELLICMAVEKIGGITPPQRAQAIRVILSELARISSHLLGFAKIAASVRSETIVHYVQRDREKILDLFELLTGGRFSHHFLRYGGVHSDITEGFLERVQETIEMLRHRIREYNDIFTFNRAFTERAIGVGVLPQAVVQELAITGPNARGSGVVQDVRKQAPYCDYEKIDFDVPTGGAEAAAHGGDVLDRFLVRLREFEQSMRILKQVCESMPSGPFRESGVGSGYQPPKGESFVRVESPRGLLACHMVSDGERSPSRVQLRTPSLFTLSAIPRLLSGARVEDLGLILASLDMSVAEADR